MARRLDIDRILQEWPFQPGEVLSFTFFCSQNGPGPADADTEMMALAARLPEAPPFMPYVACRRASSEA